MIYLCLTILANTGIAFGMRYTESHQGNRYAATVFTYIVCAILSFMLMEDKRLFFDNDAGWFTLGFACFNGFCMTAGMILIRMGIGVNGTPITTTFNKLGILIPTVFSIALFNELPKAVQVIGIALAVFSIIYINGGSDNNIKSKKLLIGIFLIGGVVDLNTKIYQFYGSAHMQAHYMFYTFVFCIFISLGIMFIKDRHFTKQDIIAGAVTGIPNQLNLFFNLKAVSILPAYLVFPAASAGTIFLVNVINFAVFREKLSKREKIATVIIAAALILINIR